MNRFLFHSLVGALPCLALLLSGCATSNNVIIPNAAVAAAGEKDFPTKPQFEWCANQDFTVYHNDAGKRVFTKRCYNQSATTSPLTTPPSTLIWTLTQTRIMLYEETLQIRVWFTPVVNLGEGLQITPYVTEFDPTRNRRERLNLSWSEDKNVTVFTPGCGDSGREAYYQTVIARDQFNDLVQGDRMAGNLVLGWNANGTIQGHGYVQCRPL